MMSLILTTEFENQTFYGLDELYVPEINGQAFPKWAYQLSGLVLALTGFLGILFNSIGLYVFAKDKQLQSPTNLFIIALLICDLSMAVFGVPLSAAAALHGSWFAGHVWCTWEGFIVYLFGLSALYILTAISVDRYIVIVKPQKSKVVSKRVALGAAIACFGGGAFWSVLPFFGWSSYGLEAAGFYCGLSYRDRSLSNKTYIIAIFIFCFALPISIMAYCYFLVYMTIRHISQNNVWDMNSQMARNNLRIQKKMLKTILLMCGCFLVCWTPYAIMAFWQSFGDADGIPLALTAFPAVLAKSELVWNPIIYVATNKRFRNAFYAKIPCRSVRERFIQQENSREPDSSNTNMADTRTRSTMSRTATASFFMQNLSRNPVAVAPQDAGMSNVPERF